ncbi:hypothetical protein EDD11_007626 [Mortierella claussenii]|nr:hypothetical protein EDD11_007626 [Mortierella claussenii]
MDIERIPMAYEQLLRGGVDVYGGEDWEQGQERDADGAIGLDRLVEFRDGLEDRMDYGEGPYMEQFFRRCHRLQKLSIAAGHPELFLWAAEEALQRCVPSSPSLPSSPLSKSSLSPSSSLSCHPARHGAVLPCLQNLHLWSKGFCRFSLQALNDAMTAFASSLQSITWEVSLIDHVRAGHKQDLPIHRVHALRSLQLRSVASANTVGDWPFLLPRLTSLSLRITAGVTTCIETGTFAQAPNLGILSFCIPVVLTTAQRQEQQQQQQQAGQVWQEGREYGMDEECEGGDCDGREEEEQEEDYTSPHWHGGNVLMDAEQQGIKVNKMTLFSPWVLPQLKELNLHGMPAIRFDFRSLQSMKRLEKLIMSMDKETLRAFPVSEYKDLQKKTWKSYWHEKEEGQEQDEGREQGEGQERRHGYEQEHESRYGRLEGVDRRDLLLQMWALPKLKVLWMEGVPAIMFWLDWLRVCPELEDMTLGARSDDKIPSLSITRMPFFFSDGIHWSSSKRDSDSMDMQGERCDKEDDDVPLLNSQLSKIELKGTWRTTPQDVIRLLTEYAPFLRQLHVGRIHLGRDTRKSGYQFLKAIMDADHINQAYAESWHLAQQYPAVELGQAQETELKQTQDNGLRQGQGRQEQRMPGTALTAVLSEQLAISRKDKALLKLSILTMEQVSEFCRLSDRSLRVYMMKDQSLVRKQDLQAAGEVIRSKRANK